MSGRRARSRSRSRSRGRRPHGRPSSPPRRSIRSSRYGGDDRGRDRDRKRERERRDGPRSRSPIDRNKRGISSRSRSRSPRGGRHGNRRRRSRTPPLSRHSDRDVKRGSSRRPPSRSRSPDERGKRDRGAAFGQRVVKKKEEERKQKEKEKPVIHDGMSMEEQMRAMGLPVGFDTTQGKKVEDEKVNAHGVRLKTQRQYRQYMNRRGGFNRPLDETY